MADGIDQGFTVHVGLGVFPVKEGNYLVDPLWCQER